MIGHAPDPVFAPVHSQTAFEETLERLGTAIKLGLLEPGERLPAERELCGQLGISRSTLRQALTALVQSGHMHALRGRRGVKSCRVLSVSTLRCSESIQPKQSASSTDSS